MLETRRLSEKTRSYAVWGKGRWSPSLMLVSALLLCLSMTFGLYWPQTERNQSQQLNQYQDVKPTVQNLQHMFEAAQTIDAAMSQEIQTQLTQLLNFRNAHSLKLDTNSIRDPQTFFGRLNLMVDDLKILQTTLDLLANQDRLVQELVIMKTTMIAKRYPEGSPAKAFQWASQSWVDAHGSIQLGKPRSWKNLEDEKLLWQHMIGQLAAVEIDLQTPDSGVRKQATNDLWEQLSSSGRLDLLRQTDAMYAQVLLAKNRLSASVEQMQNEPLPEVKSDQIWQWLIFPGTVAQGLLWLVALLLVTLFIQVLQQFGHKRGMHQLAEAWLDWSSRQEIQIRKTSPILVSLHTAIEKMSDGLGLLADSLSQASKTAQVKKDEDQLALSWQGVHKLKLDIYQDVQLTREKLLNVHTQFCSGATRENLIYDMAYIAQALETVEGSVQALSRHLDLVSEKSQDEVLLPLQELVEGWSAEVVEFKRQLQAMRKNVDVVDGMIDLVVEDVPQNLRFDAMPRYDISAR